MDKKHNKLLHKLKHLKRGNLINNNWTEESPRPRDWESIYRNRWQHDKVVRSTHGVNCTGSCSWKIYVKDGIVTQETQQIDYPSTGDNFPQYEPRGCLEGQAIHGIRIVQLELNIHIFVKTYMNYGKMNLKKYKIQFKHGKTLLMIEKKDRSILRHVEKVAS